MTKEALLAGLRAKFPEVEEKHLEWAAIELYAAFAANPDRINEIFFARVEEGLRVGHESAIQMAMASVRAVAA